MKKTATSKVADTLAALTKIANELDARGLVDESDKIDRLITKTSASEYHDFGDPETEIWDLLTEDLPEGSMEAKPPKSREDMYEEEEREARRNPKPPMTKEEHDAYMSLYEEGPATETDEPWGEGSERGYGGWEERPAKFRDYSPGDKRIHNLLYTFVNKNLGQEAVIYDHMGDTTPLWDVSEEPQSQELRGYMIEVMPDRLADLSQELEMPMAETLEAVLEMAEDDISTGQQDSGRGYLSDYRAAIDSMKFYLEDYDLSGGYEEGR